MATNRDLLKEAIADAKAVKETAIINAKAALEEAFTPYLKEKLSAKINEMDEELDMDEEMGNEADETNDAEGMDEITLDELLAELEDEGKPEMEDENLYEAKEEEDEMSIEDMSEEDLKSFIEDVIGDMVAAGELEAGNEGEEGEGEGEEHEAGESDEEEAAEHEEGGEEEGEEEPDEEEINIDELLAEAEDEEDVNEVFGWSQKEKEEAFREKIDTKAKAWAPKGVITPTAEEIEAIVSDAKADKFAGVIGIDGKKIIYKPSKDVKWQDQFAGGGTAGQGAAGSGTQESQLPNKELKEAYNVIKTLQSELNEINLLNAKLLYTNKIFRNKSLTESQKIKVLTAFDKATSKKEAQLVYETLQESLKVSTNKSPIKESLGSASKMLGNASAKPIIEVDNQFARWQQLAGIKK